MKFFVGTAKSQIYRIQLAEWKQELVNTCHNSPINDTAFPLWEQQNNSFTFNSSINPSFFV